jgi:hypothetical protein
MKRPWFDPETGVLALDDYIPELPSYKKYVADGIITPAEVAEQALNVGERLKKFEESLSSEQHTLATDVLCETAFLYGILNYS